VAGRNRGRRSAFKLRHWKDFTMKRTALALVIASVALAAAACGQTVEPRAATGAIAGAVVGGPVGAAVGGAAGAAVGKANNEPD
jgi:hypothetical protein